VKTKATPVPIYHTACHILKYRYFKADPSNRIFQFFVQIFLLAHAVSNRRPKSHHNPMMRNGGLPG